MASSPDNGAQSSHLQLPEKTPLRRRENDSFVSPDVPLLWQQALEPATGRLHRSTFGPSITASHYGEPQFSHLKHRRSRCLHDHRHGTQYWMPWFMKATLVSPVVVVLLWLSAVALQHPLGSSTATNREVASIPRKLRQRRATQRAPHNHPGNDKLVPVYVPMGGGGGSTRKHRSIVPQEQRQDSPFLQQSPYRSDGVMPQATLRQLDGSHHFYSTLVQEGKQAQAQPVQLPHQMVIRNQDMTRPTTQLKTLDVKQVEKQQQGLRPLVAQAPQKGTPSNRIQKHFQVVQGEQPTVEGRIKSQQGSAASERWDTSERWGNVMHKHVTYDVTKQWPRQEVERKQAKVLYYDSLQTVVQGHFHAPAFVYDEHGNEIKIEALIGSSSQVYLESPQMMALPVYESNENMDLLTEASASTNLTTHAGITASFPFVSPPPPLQMKIQAPESWGKSSSQDQSIIVCTVAVMALLVGALSARRLRGRSFLASCIENEILEDEVAFDSAYTITGGDGYNTFGWKGDLEKFDV